jgi:hypothetical protein
MAILRWSNSALDLLQQCGEKFRRRHIEGERGPTSLSRARGVAVHKVGSTSHLRMMDTKTEGGGPLQVVMSIPSPEEAADIAADEFDRSLDGQEVYYNQDEKEEGEGKARGREKDNSVAMGQHYTEVVVSVNPIAVERKIEVRPKDSDVTIVGILDLVDFNADLGEVVVDLKTSTRKPPKGTADSSQQLTIYTLLRFAETGVRPSAARLNTMVRTKGGKTSHDIQTTTRTEEDIRAFVDRLNAGIDAVKKGSFLPAPTGSWMCSPKYCEFWNTCRYVIGRRS